MPCSPSASSPATWSRTVLLTICSLLKTTSRHSRRISGSSFATVVNPISVSLFVLGGDFWAKIRALFVYSYKICASAANQAGQLTGTVTIGAVCPSLVSTRLNSSMRNTKSTFDDSSS